MDPDKPLAVLQVRPRDLSSHALVVGDPQRAADAARLLDDPRELAYAREYRTFAGTYRGKRVTICSHGVGASGANVCFAELFVGGVKTVIRAGTCGALVASIDDGDLIVATGAIREDGVSEKLIPLAYPALADRHVVAALEDAAATQPHLSLHVGVALTTATLYPGLLPPATDLWMRAGAVCVEMELATLLVMAGLSGVRAGGIFTSDGNLARAVTPALDPAAYDPHREIVSQGKDAMLRVALEALARL